MEYEKEPELEAEERNKHIEQVEWHNDSCVACEKEEEADADAVVDVDEEIDVEEKETELVKKQEINVEREE